MIRGIQKDYHANRHQYEGDEVFEISIKIDDEITDFLQKFWEKAQQGDYSIRGHNNLMHRCLTYNARHTGQQKQILISKLRTYLLVKFPVLKIRLERFWIEHHLHCI